MEAQKCTDTAHIRPFQTQVTQQATQLTNFDLQSTVPGRRLRGEMSIARLRAPSVFPAPSTPQLLEQMPFLESNRSACAQAHLIDHVTDRMATSYVRCNLAEIVYKPDLIECTLSRAFLRQ